MNTTTLPEPVVGFKWRRSWAALPIDEKIRIKTVQIANQEDPETRHIMRCLAQFHSGQVRVRAVRVKAVGWIKRERGLA